VEYFRHKLTRVSEIEQDNLKQNQAKMKPWYDKDAIIREFKSGEKVIVLLLIHCHPLQAKYFWPYVIESRLNDLNYIANTPRRRKKRQIWQVTTHCFSKEYKLTVDAGDVSVGAELQFVFKTLTKISKNNPQLKKNDLPYCFL
jgi:hypothetical protein